MTDGALGGLGVNQLSRVAGGDTIREPLVNFRFEPAVPRAANRHPFWECARFLQPPEMHGALGNAACAEIAITEQGHDRPRADPTTSVWIHDMECRLRHCRH